MIGLAFCAWPCRLAAPACWVCAFATKANAQLVQTGQAKQSKCPLSGGDLNKETEITVGGAKVQFCCNMCKGKVEKAEGDKKLEMVFSDDAWKKAGFKVEKK